MDGYRGSTGISEIQSLTKEQGIELKVLDEFLVSGHSTRSTKIREAIMQADFKQAKLLLGRSYIIDLETIAKKRKPFKNKTTWQFSIKKILQVLPPEGQYKLNVLTSSGTIEAICIREAHFLRLELHEKSADRVLAMSFG